MNRWTGSEHRRDETVPYNDHSRYTYSDRQNRPLEGTMLIRRDSGVTNGKKFAVSMDRVKPAYLDRLVTENANPVFQSNPPVKETEKPIPAARSGRHFPRLLPTTSRRVRHLA
ncbi:hypothetical protein ACTXT7_008807 [Hymenolepis weldensis]